MSTPIQPNITKETLLTSTKSVKETTTLAAPPTPQKLRILSLDGGGIRGIIPAMILADMEARLQTETQNPYARIIDQFDMVAGTSAGTILACLYTVRSERDPSQPKFSAKEILDLYLNGGCKTFNTPAAEGNRAEKYCSASLASALQKNLGATTRLDQLIKPVAITAYNFDQQMPVVFESWKSKQPYAWEVARASSAAPGMFKPMVIQGLGEDQFIDGSIFASNPTLCAFAAAKTLHSFNSLDTRMQVVSIGTGKTLVDPSAKKASIFRTLMATMMTSGGDLVHQQMQQLFADGSAGSYHRLNPILPKIDPAIDKVECGMVNALHEAGKVYLQDAASLVNAVLKGLG